MGTAGETRERKAVVAQDGRRVPLGTFPLAEQERLVVDDLLFLLMVSVSFHLFATN